MYVVLLGDFVLVVDVDFDECDFVGFGVFVGERFEMGGYYFVWIVLIGVDYIV